LHRKTIFCPFPKIISDVSPESRGLGELRFLRRTKLRKPIWLQPRAPFSQATFSCPRPVSRGGAKNGPSISRRISRSETDWIAGPQLAFLSDWSQFPGAAGVRRRREPVVLRSRPKSAFLPKISVPNLGRQTPLKSFPGKYGRVRCGRIRDSFPPLDKFCFPIPRRAPPRVQTNVGLIFVRRTSNPRGYKKIRCQKKKIFPPNGGSQFFHLISKELTISPCWFKSRGLTPCRPMEITK